MTSPALYVDVHILQTVPPSNLNRDDAGSPKQAIYGGVRRSRVSSQAWKRATRKYFAASMPLGSQATRTARIASVLIERLATKGGFDREQADRIATKLLEPLKITKKEKKTKSENEVEEVDSTAYLLFFGRSQIDRIVDHVMDKIGGGAEQLSDHQLTDALAAVSIADELKTGHPLDVALFGRMVADLPTLNVDAAVQVAHAISTHPVEIEFDYFTAVDDEKDRASGDDTGAGMIGTVEFNSATLYRYATVGVHQLLANLGGLREDTVGAVSRFLDGFARSMPTGHQTTFAHRTLPEAVVVIARDDQPVNLSSAFEQPVGAGEGYVQGSLVALAKACREVSERWGGEPRLVACSYQPTGAEAVLGALGPSMPFEKVLAVTSGVVRDHLVALSS